MKRHWWLLLIPIVLILTAIVSYFLFKTNSSNNRSRSQNLIPDFLTSLFDRNEQIAVNIKPKKVYAPILLYHKLIKVEPQDSYSVSPEIFDQQLTWLEDNGYTVISMENLYSALAGDGDLPANPVVITFDDGDSNQYSNALPILKKHRMKATFFIKLNNIGKEGGMSWSQIKTLSRAGMTIGSHSVNHDNMSQMDETTMRYELVQSKKILEKEIGEKIKFFAYPGGAYSQATIKATEDAGYLAAVTTHHNVYQQIRKKDDLYTLARVHIDDEMPSFIEWVQGINLK